MYDQPNAYKPNNGPQQYYAQPGATAQPYFVEQQQYGGAGNAQTVAHIKPENQQASSGFRDWPFAILFVLNVAAMVGLMAIWGIKSIKDGGWDVETTSDNKDSHFITAKETKVVLGVALAMAVIAVVLALALVKLIVLYASCMITFVLWFNVGLSFAVAAYGFYIGSIFLGVFGLIIALLNLCYARCVMHRIPFAVANLRVAAAAISKHATTYCVAITMTIIQIAWVGVWALAFLGVANHLRGEKSGSAAAATGIKAIGEQCFSNSECASNYCTKKSSSSTVKTCHTQSSMSTFTNDDPVNYVIYFFMLVSFYWGLQVFKNISHTTIAGTVASFWFSADSKGATGSALKRSCTTSLGSICLGSLIVAILQALRAMAEQAKEEGSAAACFAECILGCLQSLMEYFNRWAYVYVGIYGYKFTQAGKAVFDLFHQRGFDAIINDDLIGTVLSFAALAVGLICAGAGALVANYTDIVDFEHSTVFLAVLGFIVGVGIAVTPLSVIDSSVATIFVCFAEDPAAFLQSHPDLYQPLVTEWHNLYPEIMVSAGYYYA
ncbi:TPA: hypothetical protein N0F65_011016 [Lagenidium giganteum]|uniref:Choline transporter-like protein n=1 Tax=Lagenidium giganteum TaxID=4803 RepID=A0AAV2Z948_9STRA|nr:TPA: hypothetical protein N0F65_011016 [Lagenidium giganteum]